MDATSINKRVRDYLDELGLDNVDLGAPMYDGKYWHVLVTLGDKMLGTVITDNEGVAFEESSYPLTKIQKESKITL